MKIKFDKNGEFKVEISDDNVVLFKKNKETGCLDITLPYTCYANNLGKILRNETFSIVGTMVMIEEEHLKMMQERNQKIKEKLLGTNFSDCKENMELILKHWGSFSFEQIIENHKLELIIK